MLHRVAEWILAIPNSIPILFGTDPEKSRSRKSAQDDKWSFCLMAGTLWPANQERP